MAVTGAASVADFREEAAVVSPAEAAVLAGAAPLDDGSREDAEIIETPL